MTSADRQLGETSHGSGSESMMARADSPRKDTDAEHRSCGISTERGDCPARPGVALARLWRWRVQVQATVAFPAGTWWWR
ncbi:extensin [Iris pallida]|uniref:Extensin n=1 Tax=Iris pallida TaxID=29817 RepID=A0AAX6F8V7_IRIPA|nr:extensin [Iris pallida]